MMNDDPQSSARTVALFTLVALLSGVAAAPFLGVKPGNFLRGGGRSAAPAPEDKAKKSETARKPAPPKPARPPRYGWEKVSEETETWGGSWSKGAARPAAKPPRLPSPPGYRPPPAGGDGPDRSPFESKRTGS